MPTPEQLYVQVDGVFVCSAEAGQRHQEGKAALIFSDRKVEISKDRMMLLEKSYAGSYQGSEAFGKQVYARAYRMGCERAGEVIVMGDGAKWIKGLREFHFPDARFILDWWHLKEKVWQTLRQVICSDEKREELGKRLCALLWEGEVGEALKVLEALSDDDLGQGEGGRKSVRELIGYVENNRAGVGNYEELQAAGYYIGTGPVEKAGETVIVKRQKKQGMRWRRGGAEVVMQLRLKRLNGEWERYWAERMSLN